jgi:hypothetical protein
MLNRFRQWIAALREFVLWPSSYDEHTHPDSYGARMLRRAIERD